MEGKDNLKPARSKSEARERGAKGGKASGAARRQKRALKDCLESILTKPTTNEELMVLLASSGVENTYDNAMSLALIHKALSGDPKAFEVVRDTIGQKPTDKMQISTPVPLKIEVDYGDDEGSV